MKKTFFVIIYIIGLLLLILTIGYKMIITSDIPPVYTIKDLSINYTFSFITFITWLIIFKLSNDKDLLKWLAKSSPLFLALIIPIISIIHGKSTYIYYSSKLFSLDMTLLITFIVNILYAYYKFTRDIKLKSNIIK